MDSALRIFSVCVPAVFGFFWAPLGLKATVPKRGTSTKGCLVGSVLGLCLEYLNMDSVPKGLLPSHRWIQGAQWKESHAKPASWQQLAISAISGFLGCGPACEMGLEASICIRTVGFRGNLSLGICSHLCSRRPKSIWKAGFGSPFDSTTVRSRALFFVFFYFLGRVFFEVNTNMMCICLPGTCFFFFFPPAFSAMPQQQGLQASRDCNSEHLWAAPVPVRSMTRSFHASSMG